MISTQPAISPGPTRCSPITSPDLTRRRHYIAAQAGRELGNDRNSNVDQRIQNGFASNVDILQCSLVASEKLTEHSLMHTSRDSRLYPACFGFPDKPLLYKSGLPAEVGSIARNISNMYGGNTAIQRPLFINTPSQH